jgi:phenylpropionate dioxygenase-like ring-hydroxylating dioxygenase large terminal subunit
MITIQPTSGTTRPAGAVGVRGRRGSVARRGFGASKGDARRAFGVTLRERFAASGAATTRCERVGRRVTTTTTTTMGVGRTRALQTAEDTPVDAGAAFDWRANWFPVAFTADLEDDAPLTFTLLGEPLVFWRDKSGEMRCVADRCPHRLVPLSEGRVNETGELECGYHGWTFTGEGKCTSIPQIEQGTGLETALKSPRSCVAAYPTKEAQGMLWVYPTSMDKAPATLPDLPLIPEYDDPECVCQDIFRDLPMDWATLLENVMDVSHVPFTHHNSVGKRENATPVNLELTSENGVTAKGFEGIWKEGPRKGKYGTQFTEYQAPTLMRHTLRTPSFTTLTVVYAVPTTPGRCRLMARFPFIFKAALPRLLFGLYPSWFSHTNQNAILEDDQIFLHKQERLIEIEQNNNGAAWNYAKSCYMPTKADVYVSAFRKWITEIAGGGPAWPKGMSTALPPQETTREALLDRYHSHTINCKSCAKALANIGKARKALRVLTFVALAAAVATFSRSMPPKYTVMLSVLSAAAALVREKLGAFAQKMKVGPYPPPRRPPSMMEAALQQARIAF